MLSKIARVKSRLVFAWTWWIISVLQIGRRRKPGRWRRSVCFWEPWRADAYGINGLNRLVSCLELGPLFLSHNFTHTILIWLGLWARKGSRLYNVRCIWSVPFIVDLYHLSFRCFTLYDMIEHYLKRVLINFVSRLILKVLVLWTNRKSAWLLLAHLQLWLNCIFESLLLHGCQVLFDIQHCSFPYHVLVRRRFETPGLPKTAWIRTFESPQVWVFVGMRSRSVFYLFKCFESLRVLWRIACLLLKNGITVRAIISRGRGCFSSIVNSLLHDFIFFWRRLCRTLRSHLWHFQLIRRRTSVVISLLKNRVCWARTKIILYEVSIKLSSPGSFIKTAVSVLRRCSLSPFVVILALDCA